MEAAWLAGLGATVAAVLLGFVEVTERHRPGSHRRVELCFGRDVTSEAVLAVLDRVAGMHRHACPAFEVVASHGGVRHFAEADQATIDNLEGALRAHLPRVQLSNARSAPHEKRVFGGSIRLGGRLRTLRVDAPGELSTGLLAALQPVGQGEQIVVRWIVRRGRQMTVPYPRGGQLVEPEERRRLRIKNEGSVLLAHGTLAVRAGHPRRAAHLLARATSVLRTRNTAYGYLRTWPVPQFWLKWLLTRRSFLLGDRYSAAELAGLLAWPIDAPALPGLALGTSPRRIPNARIPASGRLIGMATWPGAQRPIAQPVLGAMSHSLIAGPTGVGKSTLLVNLIESDLQAGRGVVLIDGKGDTAEAVLDRLPANRQDEVVVLDCASGGPQPGLRLFGGPDAELAADVVLGVLSDLYRAEWGPLSERYLRAGLMAVAHDPHGTLADVPYVFSEAVYRRKLVGRLRDPLTRMTFAGFEAMSAAERQQQLAAPMNKLGQLLGRPIVRTVLGQVAPQLDFREVLRRNQIVVISLAPARVGAPAARLIGALSVFALFQAVQARSGLSERGRRPFMVYIDEPRALGHLPMPLDALLEQARGLAVGVTLAPQSIRQVAKAVQAAALTNVATRVVFRQDADDAGLLARDLSGVSAEDLGDLAAYEAVARINLGPGDLAPPVTIRTRPLSKATANGKEVAQYSAKRFGQTLEQVDAALQKRHQLAPAAPVGRKRRQA